MALIACITCGFFGWLCVWVLFGGGENRKDSFGARLHTVESLVRRGLVMIGHSDPVRMLHTWPPFFEVGEDLSVWSKKQGKAMSANEAEAAVVVLLALSSALGFVAAQSAVGAAVLPLCALLGLQMRHAARVRNRSKCLAEEMPGILRTMANALESGQTLVQAVDYVGLHESGPAAESFSRTSLRLRCGMSIESSLEELARELDAPGVRLLVTALSISQRTGSPLRDLLRRSASLVEQQGEFERLLSVRTAQVRLSVRIVCGMPVAMVCLLTLISADFRQGVISAPGMTCLLLAAAMDGLAIVLIRRILSGVL